MASSRTSLTVHRDRSFLTALVIAVVVALGFGLVIPVLPLFARSFGVGLFAVTGIVSVFAGVRLASNLYTGVIADRIGTRRAIGWGAVVVAVSSALAGAAPGYWWLIIVRGIGGFGSALFFNALMTLIIRIVPADQRGRAIGLLQGSFLVGISLGPTVGGLLAAPLGLRWPLVIYGGFCLAAGVVAFLYLPEADDVPASVVDDEATDRERATTGGLRSLLRTAAGFCTDRTFVAALVMMAASRWAATGVRFSLVPIFGAEEVGASVLVVSFSLTLAALTHMVTLWPAGRIADTHGRRALGVPAYFIYAAAAAMLPLATTVVLFLIVMALYGVGTGLTSPTPAAIVGDIVDTRQTGRAVGVLNTAGDLGSVLGPLVSGYLAQQAGYGWGFGASAVLLAVGGVVALGMRETLPARAEPARA